MTIERTTVGVVIPTKGRWATLVPLVDSLLRIRFVAEISVVCDAINPHSTLVNLQRSSNSLRIVVSESGDSVNALRDIGAIGCQSNYLVFLDDDVELAASWSGAVRDLIDSGTDCASGPIEEVGEGLASRGRRVRYAQYEHLGVNSKHPFQFSGGNSLISRYAYEKVGGFERHSSTQGVVSDLRHQGFALKYESGMRIRHYCDQGLRYEFLMGVRKGECSSMSTYIRLTKIGLRSCLEGSLAARLVNGLWTSGVFYGFTLSRAKLTFSARRRRAIV